ncbi:MAG: YceD family protein [Candidatus Nanopelagicaceae bacterium]
MTSKAFRFNTHELPRRAGEMKEYHLTIDLEEAIGIDVISVPKGPLEIDLRLESVSEGVLVTGEFEVTAQGECIRCLEPIELKLEKNFQELYAYKAVKSSKDSSKDSKKQSNRDSNKEIEKEIEEEDDTDQLLMDGDYINLEAPIRDAIVLSLPINPLCAEDCEGLCPDCGQNWRDLPEDHSHEQIDARWSGLKGLLEPEK